MQHTPFGVPSSDRRGGRAALAALGLAGLLAACVAPPGGAAPGTAPQAGLAAAVAGDGYDGCGPQVTVFVSAGDLLGAPPRRQGTPSAAELAAELARENAALDRLQAVFDALVYCRWTEVRLVRDAASVGRLALPTARARIAQTTARLRTDVARAGEFRARVADRARQREAAIEAAQPGLRIARDGVGGGLPAVSSDIVTLRAQPDGSSREVGRVPARAEVQVAPAAHGFALVQAGGLRGFARAESFARLAPRATGAEDLRVLAASNVARREAFFETVNLAQRAAETGFEIAL